MNKYFNFKDDEEEEEDYDAEFGGAPVSDC